MNNRTCLQVFLSLSLSILNPGSDEFLISKVSDFRKSLHSIISFVKREKRAREGKKKEESAKVNPTTFRYGEISEGRNLPEFGFTALSTTRQSSLTLCHLRYGHLLYLSPSLWITKTHKVTEERKDEEGEMDLCVV